jgi:ribosomal protein S18 acetylase RimI-like enzyme
MTVEVTRAAQADLDDLARLALEMEAHYGATDLQPHAVARERIADAVFGSQPQALAFIARIGAAAAGMAFLSFLFPTTNFRPGLFIKDIYVSADMRRRGVGRQILRAVGRFARDEGYTRIDWTADAGNDVAVRLYDSLGARDPEKIFFRVRESDYRRMTD